MARIFHRMLCVFAILTLAGCCARQCQPPLHDNFAGARLTPINATEVDGVAAPGDIVNVTIEGENDLNGAYTVGANGKIGLPLIGDVAAAGNTKAKLEVMITDAYRKGYLINPKVHVDISVPHG